MPPSGADGIVGIMNQAKRTGTGLAAGLLGVTAAGAALFGVILPILVLSVHGLGGPGGVAAAIIGVISVAFGLAAAFATWAVLTERRIGSVVGLAIGAIVVLSATLASASGGWHPALAVALALGGGIVVSLLAARGPRSIAAQG
jgi:hypothetical protein